MKHYKVHVFTGDKWRGGTDANVYLCIYGEKGDTGKRQLKQSSTNRNKFERNQEDIFDIECADLGRLNKILIGHDNANFGCVH